MKTSLLRVLTFCLAMVGVDSKGQNAILTFQNLLSVRDEIEFLRVWEKLSVTEREKAQRLYSFQPVSLKDIKPEGFSELILQEASKASPKKPNEQKLTLEPEMESFQVKVTVGECQSAKSFLNPFIPFLGSSIAFAQTAGAPTSARNRTWWDEVKAELCLQPFEITKTLFCENSETLPTVAPLATPSKDLSLSSNAFKDSQKPAVQECDRLIQILWSSSKDAGLLVATRTSALSDGVKKSALRETLNEKIIVLLTKRRILRDQAKSGIAEGDYLRVASLPSREIFLKLGLYLSQQGVTDRDLENPCIKLGSFFRLYSVEPSSSYTDRCSSSSARAKKIQFPLTPQLSPAQAASREQIIGYHGQSVRIANHVMSAISQTRNSNILLLSENPVIEKIETAIEKGLFSFLASEIASYARMRVSDPGFDLEAKIASEVIQFMKGNDSAQIAYETQGLSEILAFFNLLKEFLGEVPESSETSLRELKSKTMSMIEEQITLIQKIKAEISRRKAN
jgi:hypothetical protein